MPHFLPLKTSLLLLAKLLPRSKRGVKNINCKNVVIFKIKYFEIHTPFAPYRQTFQIITFPSQNQSLFHHNFILHMTLYQIHPQKNAHQNHYSSSGHLIFYSYSLTVSQEIGLSIVKHCLCCAPPT